MQKGKTSGEEKHNMKNMEETPDTNNPEQCQVNEEGAGNCEADNSEEANEINDIKGQLEEKSKLCEEYFDKLQRIMAEFDNYKKRTAKEKVDLYSDAVCEVAGAILPVLDNLERAIKASNCENNNSLKEGIELVLRQFKEAFKALGVEEIKGVGEKFDPNMHNAVMHIDDESYDENFIVEEFQKGYIYKEKVVRYSMVKVAN